MKLPELAVPTIIPIAIAAVMQACSGNTGSRANISPDDLRARIQGGDTSIVLVDVRTEEEYRSETGHLAGSILIPVQQLKQRVGELGEYRNKTIVAYCRTGHRSAQAAEILSGEGFATLNMTGGIREWNQKHFPVDKEKAP